MTTIQLKGGATTTDPRLDAVKEFDERSRNYPATAVLTDAIAYKTWANKYRLDQGQEGACTGFGWSHEVGAKPVVATVTNKFAKRWYRINQDHDEWPGHSYDGSSVLAGAKVGVMLGFYDSYHWALGGIDDVLRALSQEGPVVFGLPWLEGMFDSRKSGLLNVDGEEAGRHCIMARGHNRRKLAGEGKHSIHYIRFTNSWGDGWGRDGECLMRVEDVEELLGREGECCIPLYRRHPRVIDWPTPQP